MHWFKIWSSGGATCIGSKIGRQVASLHCHIAFNCPIGIICLSIDLVSSFAASFKSAKGGGVRENRTQRSDPRFT